jgi:DNA-binding response OmpR family regulator
MEPTRSILLAEEDHVLRTILADNLTADGFAVTVARNKPDALERLCARQPDLVVCDVNGTTLELVDAVRQAPGLAAEIDPDVPLIVLTARSDELARVRYLDHGCDDVVTRPVCYPELLARIRAVLRRTYDRPGGRVLRVGALRIDIAGRAVHLDGRPVELAGREYALLVHLASEPTRVFEKQDLLREVWGYRANGSTRTLDSHAIRLRRKLRTAHDHAWVQNVWGVGYRLAPVEPGDSDVPTAA